MDNQTTLHGIENGRAEFAYKCAIEGNKLNKLEDKKKYKSYVKNIPMLIKTNGMAATLGFMMSKGETYEIIGKQIVEWFKLDSNNIINIPEKMDFKDFVKMTTELDSAKYRLMTVELLAFLTWLKRFASGLIEDNEEKK